MFHVPLLFSLVIYSAKKLDLLSCGVPQVTDFAAYVPVLFNVVYCPLNFL